MLISARSRAGTWFIRILFGALALSFALWGVQDMLRFQSTKPVARVGDTKITQQDYYQEFQRTVQRLRTSFGSDFDSSKARQFGIDRQVLSQMVSRALFDTEVRDLGLTVPDAQVAAAIRANPIFHDQSGKFDRARFDALMRANGLTEQSFAEILRGDLARRQLLAAVSGGIQGPEPVARLLYAYRNEERGVRVVAVPTSAVEAIPAPSEADLRAYYEAHKDAFAKPEYRKISYFVVRPADVAANSQIPEADLRQAYEERKASFSVPERRDFVQMLFREREQAAAAAERLSSGAGAEQVAKAAEGLIASTEVKAARSDELLPSIQKAVFSTAAGKVAGPVDSPLGWAVVRVDKVLPAETQSFDEVRDSLREALATERANEQMYEVANQIEDERAGGATLAEVAKIFGVPVRTVEAIDRSGKDPDGEPAKELPDAPDLLDIVFTAQVDEDLNPLELQTGGYAVVRVDAITPAATPPFEAVKDEVLAQQQEAARETAAQKLAEKIAAEARKSGDLAAAAKQAGLSVRNLGMIKRDYRGEALAPELVGKLFAAKQGAILDGPLAEGQVVAQVATVQTADPSSHPDSVQALQAEIAAKMGEDVLRQYQSALEKQHDVEVNIDVAEAVIGRPQD